MHRCGFLVPVLVVSDHVAQYDLDGDGVVGVREYYFAARMDKDVSGQLDSKEKLQGLKDLQENISSVMFVDVSVARFFVVD